MSAVAEHRATNGIPSLVSRMSSTSTDQRKSSGSSGSPVSASSLPPTELFPLEGLLEELLHQEAELWRRNELLMQSLRPVNGGPGSSPVLEVTDVVSLGSILNSNQQSEDGQYEIDKRLYLIKYGKLPRTIHKYFRRLEQRHACLYLTATRAKRDTLRHVERLDETSEGPPDLQSSTSAEPAENGRQLVNLRDDETLVYRCALMCAQFPMLSAPEPPDGGSPTPPPPTLPLRFTDVIGSAASVARTVPDDFLTSLQPDRVTEASSGIPTTAISNGHLQPSHQLPNGLGPGEAELNQDTSDRQKKRSRHIKRLNRTSSSGSKGSRVSPESPEVKVKTHDSTDHVNGMVDRHNPSEPIPIVRTGSKRMSRRKRDSMSLVNGDSSQLAKLPAVDSDEEDELIQLTANKQPNELSSTDHLGREHPFSPMVNREMLSNIVRRAFHQTEEQQTNFEQMLKHEYGRRSKGEILAKELAGQLQVLENNAHPFYKPKLFVTRNGYDLWLQAEKQRVRNMIDKFWHFSLPRPQLWRHYNPTDYHKAYGTLLQKVICCESRTDRREPVHSGKTPSSPLSPTSVRLLTEFGLRYGVGELYRRIIYLDYLAKHFDYEIWYIKHCTEELRGIRELLPRSRNKITAVRKEMEMLRATVHLLHGQTDNSLTRIDRLFMDSDPKEGVASLIELLAEVLDAEQSLFGKKVRPVEDWLKRYLRSGFVLRYERRKEIAADETIQSRTAHPFVLTPTLINSILLDTRDEVYDYKEKFQSVFRPYFDIVPFAKEEFYRLLCADACALCASVIHRQESRQSVSLEMLGLMYRLNERDLEWENVIPSESQTWRQKFVDLALIWMEVFGKQINKWVVTAVAQDQWMMLSLINPPFTSREPIDSPDHALSSPLHSPSAGAYRPSPKFMANASVRLSPFPSPIAGDMGSAFSPAPRLLGGAFTPYKRPVLKRPAKSPVLSEGSGAITDNSSPCAGSSTTSIDRSTCGSSVTGAGELTDILVKGTKQCNEKDTPAESLLKFSQSAPEYQPYVFDTIGEHVGNEIEVSVSVYSGYDPTDDASPTPAKVTDETILQVESSDQPQSTQRDSPDGESHDSNANLETSAQLADQQSSTTAVTDTAATVESISGSNDQNGKLQPLLKESLEPVDQSLVDHQDKQPSTASTSAAQLEGEVATLSHSESTRTTVNSSEGGLSGITVLPKLAVVHKANRGDQSKKHRKRRWHSSGANSDYVSSIDSRLRVGAKPEEPVVKFGNMLDHCNSEGSDADLPKVVKPTVVRPTGVKTKSDLFNKRGYQSATGTDEFHIPPASVGTVPELADWRKDHAYGSYATNGSSSGSNMGSSSHTSMEESQDTLKETSDGEASLEPQSSASCTGGPQQAFLFPVSNSPMDIVTMLVRLASFTGTLLGVLIPKLKSSTFTAGKPVNEYAPDVAAAREQANQQLRFAENTRKELLKKLHRTMLSALRLYADNLLCMDLCGWSGVDAIKLLGEEKVHSLKRRKDVGEVWGCRHMVEARHGLHPHGLPCQKRTPSKEFKSITRDMCVRINNIHTMINIFESLENHLYSCMRTALPKPISAFGYVSSDPGELSPRPMTDKSLQPNPHHTLPDNETTSDGPASVKAARRGHFPSSLPLGSMERDDSGRRMDEGRKPDVGFKSKESDQLLEYLRTAQRAQFRLICIRMNVFFKPALSLLMDLKLRDCSIEKRLRPLMTFLTRHRSALQKYIYKDCFNTIMEYLWEHILRDLEDEAVKLRTHKQPVTDRAQMLNQTLSHLIQFMYNRGDGLPLELLTSSSEYLQGLLDIMTRSTDQLMSIFSRLSAPQFARGHFDISKAPVPIDGRVLHTLRLQLHAIKKCFSGKEFVDKVLEIGRNYGAMMENLSDTDSPGSLRRSSSLGGTHVLSPTGQPIEYTTRYACEVGQFLLKERMLIQLPKSGARDDNPSLTPQHSLETRRRHHQLTASFEHPDVSFESSYSHDYSPGMSRSTLGSRGTGASSTESVGRGTRRDGYQYRYHRRGDIGRIRDPAPEFMNSPTTFYKFTDSEDKEQSSQYQGQILVGSSHVVLGPNASPQPVTAAGGQGQPHFTNRTRTEPGEDQVEFMNARRETLFLVFDLLVQRAKKEKRAKQFLQTPRALEVQGQRRANAHTNCDLIIKM